MLLCWSLGTCICECLSFKLSTPQLGQSLPRGSRPVSCTGIERAGPTEVAGETVGRWQAWSTSLFLSRLPAQHWVEPLPYKWLAWWQQSKLHPAAGSEGSSFFFSQHGPICVGHLLPPGEPSVPCGHPQPWSQPQCASSAALLQRYWPVLSCLCACCECL